MKDATMRELVEWLDKNGWKKGYRQLKRLHEYLENKQAFLFAEPSSEAQAARMSPRLAKQDVTLKRIEIIARQKKIDIGEIHG